MKKRFAVLAAALLLLGSAVTVQAEIIPPESGGWQIGPPAIVLCDSLSVRTEKSSASDVVKTLQYGDRMMVLDQSGEWAQCVLSDDVDGGPEGWVNASYIVVNPAWYVADESTAVYAWDDLSALKVANLSEGTRLPILKEEGDWLIVSLRGATGWVHKTAADQ